MLESEYQSKLIKKLKLIFPDCEILKNDPHYKKNIPDLVIFYHDKYALLEVKRSKSAYESSRKEDGRLNQEYYVNKFNDWSFASFIYPENEEEVIGKLKLIFSGGVA